VAENHHRPTGTTPLVFVTSLFLVACYFGIVISQEQTFAYLRQRYLKKGQSMKKCTPVKTKITLSGYLPDHLNVSVVVQIE
jgi:hypothetical protein